MVTCAIACTLAAVSVRADTTPPSGPPNTQLRYKHLNAKEFRFVSAMHLIADRCLSCHRVSGSAPDFSSYLSSETAWVQVSLIVPGNSNDSVLYKYLQGSGFAPAPLGSMPLGGSFSEDDLALLRNWIDLMGDPIAAPTEAPTPPPSGGGERLMVPSQSAPVLGDRVYVKSVLDQIFGPDAIATTNTMVLKMVSLFGGLCDQMGQPPATGQSADTCTGVDVPIFSAPFVPAASAPRAGQTMKACNALVFMDKTLEYAVSLATQKSDLTYLTSNPMPAPAEIAAAYALFNPDGNPLSASALDQLTAVASAVREAKYPTCPSYSKNCQLDPWRYVFLSLCYDPEWQVVS